MKDALILTKDKSLFTVIAFELEGLGLTVGGFDESECSVLIVDTDSISDFSVKHKKLALVSRDPSERKCDLYVKRPVHVGILREGIRTLFAETKQKETPRAEKKDRIKPIPEERSVLVNSRRVRLSECEYLVFSKLYEKRGAAVAREELASVLGAQGGNEADVYVCLLRKKLESDGKRRIFTKRGVGYMLK